MGMFDDLIPASPSKGLFDDLIPSTPPVAKATPAPAPTDEPTAAEIEAASKPAFITKQQVLGGAALPLEEARRRAEAARAEVKPERQRKPVATGRDFTALDTAVEKLTPKPKPQAFPVMTESDKLFGPMPKPIQPMGGRNEGLVPSIAAKSPEIVSFMAEYLKTRRGNVPVPKDPVDIAETFRDSFERRTYGKIADTVWLENASPKDKETYIKAEEIYKKMGGRIEDTVAREVTDPVNLVGGAIGGVVKSQMLRLSTSLSKAQITAGATTAGVEGVVGGYSNVIEQRKRIALDQQKSMNYAEIAAVAGASMLIEGAVVGATVGKGGRLTKDRLEEWKKEYPAEEAKQNIEEFKKQFIKKEKEITAPLYESAEARKEARTETFDKEVPVKDPYQAVMTKPIVDDIFNITRQLFTDNPELRFKLEDVKTVDNIVNILGDMQPDQLQQAAARADVSPEKFLEMFKVQASEAGAFLQQNSAMSRFMQGLFKNDKQLEDSFQRMLKADSGVDHNAIAALNKAKEVTGASVGASTAGWSTTVFNALGLAGTVSIQTAGDIMQAVVKSVGRMSNDLKGGEIPTGDRLRDETGQVFADSFFILSRIADSGMSREIVDIAGKTNPRLHDFLFNVSAEFDTRGKGRLNDFIRVLNSANSAADAIVRSPIVEQALKNRMEDVGLDYRKFIANEIPIPHALYKLAVEDAQKLTFSYEFKKGTSGIIEGSAETAAAVVLETINKYQTAGIVKDLFFPFIRFSLNAARYSYRLTPMSAGFPSLKVGSIETPAVGGAFSMLQRASKLRAEGKLNEAAALSYDGRRKLLDSVIGTGLIWKAAEMQDDEPDVQFWQEKTNDGNIIDVSGAFPYVNIKALGAAFNIAKDIGAKYLYTLTMTPEERDAESQELEKQAMALDDNDPEKQRLLNKSELLGFGRIRNFDGAKFLEILAGMGRTAGTQKTFIDTFGEWMEDGIKTSTMQKAGQFTGDWISRWDNVMNPFYDGYNSATGQTQIVDPKATTGEESSPFLSQAVRTVIAPTPAKGMLADRANIFAGGETEYADPFARQLFGVRSTPQTKEIEKELIKLSIQPYSVITTTGNRDFDAIRIKLAGPEFLASVGALLKDPDYRAKTANEKQAKIKAEISKAVSSVKQDARDIFLRDFGKAAVDALYEKAPNRAAQEDAFGRILREQGKPARKPSTMAEKFGVIEGDYTDIGVVGKANGGLVSQMDKLLTKSR